MIRVLQSISSSVRGALAAFVAALALLTYGNGAAADSHPREEGQMETRSVIQGYFDALGQREGWQAWFANDMEFTSFTSPVKRINGKAAYLQATQRFYGSIRKAELRQLLVDGDRAWESCAQRPKVRASMRSSMSCTWNVLSRR